MRDGLANPLINAGIGGMLAARGFSMPVALGLGLATEIAYAAMASYTPDWFDGAHARDARAYDAADFAVDMAAVLLGWSLGAAVTGAPQAMREQRRLPP